MKQRPENKTKSRAVHMTWTWLPCTTTDGERRAVAYLDLRPGEVETQELESVLQLISIDCTRAISIHQLETGLQLHLLFVCEFWPRCLHGSCCVWPWVHLHVCLWAVAYRIHGIN